MSTLKIDFHPEARAELTALAQSALMEDRVAAAQLLTLLDLVRSHPDIRERLLTRFSSLTVKSDDGSWQQVDIKLIQELVKIADDEKFHTDAVRRIRDLNHQPADKYRVFFAQRRTRSGNFVFQVLGITHRDNAYSPANMTKLKKRYEG